MNPSNNVNGIDGDLNHDGRGTEIDTLEDSRITRLQEAYVRKVIDTVNEFDNVLYEIGNEMGPYSTDFQYHFIRFVKRYEAKKRLQHPVGMTFQWYGGSMTPSSRARPTGSRPVIQPTSRRSIRARK
jgi:hypothetical protein